ncbi:MAG: cystathionine gamma-lyase, partial [Mycobacterium sp.]|nr:cystathionine gamma-lyase [Mycobacterium sp.]
MDGQYGDSTRSVKSTASQLIPGQPVAPPPIPASAYQLSTDESLP